jgi:hypothetical protein
MPMNVFIERQTIADPFKNGPTKEDINERLPVDLDGWEKAQQREVNPYGLKRKFQINCVTRSQWDFQYPTTHFTCEGG